MLVSYRRLRAILCKDLIVDTIDNYVTCLHGFLRESFLKEEFRVGGEFLDHFAHLLLLLGQGSLLDELDLFSVII